MSWQKQMEEMVRSWTDTQRRMWDQWMDSVKTMAPGTENVQKEYHRQLDAWEESVQTALARQQEWAESLAADTGNDERQRELAEQWMAQAQETMRSWTEAQSQMWNNWVENMGDMESMSGSGQRPYGTEDVMKAWQQAADQAQRTMQQWADMAPTGGRR